MESLLDQNAGINGQSWCFELEGILEGILEETLEGTLEGTAEGD